MVDVAIYARVSSQRQEKEDTIAGQLEKLKQHAEANKYNVVSVYSDDGYSGELLERPELDRLRFDASKKLFGRVLVLAPDRLARKLEWLLHVHEELKKRGIEVEYLSQKRIETAEDEMMLQMQGVIAQYEKHKIKERTRMGRLHKARSGLLVSGQAPYGYNYIRKAHGQPARFEINEEQARTVRLIFELLSEKRRSIRSTVKELAARGVPPPTNRAGTGYWSNSTIHKVIRNETYAGTFWYNKHQACEPLNPRGATKTQTYRRSTLTSNKLRSKDLWIPTNVPAIVAQQTFDRIQKRISENRRFLTGEKKNRYLLTGMIECGLCGTRYFGTPTTGWNGKKTLYYMCAQPRRVYPAPRTCRSRGVKVPILDEIVWKALCDALRNPDVLLRQFQKVKAYAEKANGHQAMGDTDYERLMVGVKREEDKILELYRQNIITMEQVQSELGKLKERVKGLDVQRVAIEAKTEAQRMAAENVSSIEAFCMAISQGLSAIGDDVDKRQELLRLLVQKVIIEAGKVRIQAGVPVSPTLKGSVLDGCQVSTLP